MFVSLSSLPSNIEEIFMESFSRLRQKEIDSKTPVTRFPISAAWNDLSGHIQDQHPQGHSLLVQMTDAEIAVMTRTIAAEEGKAG